MQQRSPVKMCEGLVGHNDASDIYICTKCKVGYKTKQTNKNEN